jgi:hypothetical protein
MEKNSSEIQWEGNKAEFSHTWLSERSRQKCSYYAQARKDIARQLCKQDTDILYHIKIWQREKRMIQHCMLKINRKLVFLEEHLTQRNVENSPQEFWVIQESDKGMNTVDQRSNIRWSKNWNTRIQTAQSQEHSEWQGYSLPLKASFLFLLAAFYSSLIP